MSNDDPLRILVLGMHYAPEHSGNAPYTTGMARHLASTGALVEVLTGYPHYPEWRVHAGYERRRPEELDVGVRLHRVRHPVPRRPTAARRVLMEAVFAARAGAQLFRRHPDVVVAISPVLLSLAPAVLLRPVRGYRLGVVVQDLYGAALAETGIAGGLLARVTGWLEVQLLRRADAVVAIHDVIRARLVRLGVPAERVTVIPNWTHVIMPADSDRRAVRERLSWHDDEIIAVHAGNMGVKQGLEGLVDAARLAGERQRRIRVVLLGDGSRRRDLEAYGRGVAQLTFMEPLPSGPFEAALMAADVLLLHEKPGVVEMSVPSKLTSYFSAGRPVVAATHPGSGAAALMAASGGGIVVPPGDAEAILSAIEELVGDPLAMATYGRRGQAYAAERMGAAPSLRQYELWIRRMVGVDDATERAEARPGGAQKGAPT